MSSFTRDEIECIRIHMNAFKEKLCNMGWWNEAEEYQTIVDKLDDILKAESVIRCKDCDNYRHWECPVEQAGYRPMGDKYCAWAVRNTDSSGRPITCDHCKHWHGLKRDGQYWCSKHSLYMETGCEEGEMWKNETM